MRMSACVRFAISQRKYMEFLSLKWKKCIKYRTSAVAATSGWLVGMPIVCIDNARHISGNSIPVSRRACIPRGGKRGDNAGMRLCGGNIDAAFTPFYCNIQMLCDFNGCSKTKDNRLNHTRAI